MLQLCHSCLSSTQRCSGRSRLQLPLVEALPQREPSAVPKERPQKDSVVRHTKCNSSLGWVFVLVFLNKAEPFP